MNLNCSSKNLEDYLIIQPEIDFSNPLIQEKTKALFNASHSEIDQAKIAFEFVRDEIAHSWDIQSTIVTCNASDVLLHQEGICYAKSHLLAALLRAQGIPTGFCYQKLMLFDTPEKGYCVHALNAIYIRSLHKWIRVDARGNKQGVDAQFSLTEEKLAFSVTTALGEIDYPPSMTSLTLKLQPCSKNIPMPYICINFNSQRNCEYIQFALDPIFSLV